MLSKVLVVPYWNVSLNFLFIFPSKSSVLVVPYWNVNENKMISYIEDGVCFSSTILECKYIRSKWLSK